MPGPKRIGDTTQPVIAVNQLVLAGLILLSGSGSVIGAPAQGPSLKSEDGFRPGDASSPMHDMLPSAASDFHTEGNPLRDESRVLDKVVPTDGLLPSAGNMPEAGISPEEGLLPVTGQLPTEELIPLGLVSNSLKPLNTREELNVGNDQRPAVPQGTIDPRLMTAEMPSAQAKDGPKVGNHKVPTGSPGDNLEPSSVLWGQESTGPKDIPETQVVTKDTDAESRPVAPATSRDDTISSREKQVTKGSVEDTHLSHTTAQPESDTESVVESMQRIAETLKKLEKDIEIAKKKNEEKAKHKAETAATIHPGGGPLTNESRNGNGSNFWSVIGQTDKVVAKGKDPSIPDFIYPNVSSLFNERLGQAEEKDSNYTQGNGNPAINFTNVNESPNEDTGDDSMTTESWDEEEQEQQEPYGPEGGFDGYQGPSNQTVWRWNIQNDTNTTMPDPVEAALLSGEGKIAVGKVCILLNGTVVKDMEEGDCRREAGLHYRYIPARLRVNTTGGADNSSTEAYLYTVAPEEDQEAGEKDSDGVEGDGASWENAHWELFNSENRPQDSVHENDTLTALGVNNKRNDMLPDINLFPLQRKGGNATYMKESESRLQENISKVTTQDHNETKVSSGAHVPFTSSNTSTGPEPPTFGLMPGPIERRPTNNQTVSMQNPFKFEGNESRTPEEVSKIWNLEEATNNSRLDGFQQIVNGTNVGAGKPVVKGDISAISNASITSTGNRQDMNDASQSVNTAADGIEINKANIMNNKLDGKIMEPTVNATRLINSSLLSLTGAGQNQTLAHGNLSKLGQPTGSETADGHMMLGPKVWLNSTKLDTGNRSGTKVEGVQTQTDKIKEAAETDNIEAVLIYRNRYPHHAIQGLIWEDRRYMMSVLVPVGCGMAGAFIIVCVAYLTNNCRRQPKLKPQKAAPPTLPVLDRVMLLADSSDDEF